MTRIALILLFVAGCAGRTEDDVLPTPRFHPAADSALRNFPFSEAVEAGGLLHLSGQIGILPGSTALAPGGLEGEAVQTLENIKAILERRGSSMSKVVKCTIFLTDMAEWGRFNVIWRRYFSAPYPARSAFGATGLALGARVEVECIATK
ncbi:MAG: Rid family hydrolase [Actinomycetota bacterium]|nr:Rid family hydrolase [Actinomycetota bacterium]